MKPNPKILAFVLLLAAIGFELNAQPVLPISSKVVPDQTKQGFLWRVFQNQADVNAFLDHAEAALSGTLAQGGTLLPNLADPNAKGAALGPGRKLGTAENSLVEFEIPGVINFSEVAGDVNGSFTPDLQLPGVPGLGGGNDGAVGEILTFLDLPAGVITMGVNSDDGFRTGAGVTGDVFRSVVLGEFNGPRGAVETLFTFTVPEAGVYPFRTIWQGAGGGANIEWFTIKADGTRVLVNDIANGGIRAYRAASAGPKPPAVVSATPAPGNRQRNLVSSKVTVVLADGELTPITDSSILFKVDGVRVTDIQRSGKNITLTYTPTTIEFPNEIHTASLSFSSGDGVFRTDTWTFRNLKNVVLPSSALAGENFDSTAEGAQPAGWVPVNFTAPCTPGLNTADQSSDTYLNWVVVSQPTMGVLDDAGLDMVNAAETVNGQPLTIDRLRSGNVLYAESDSRCNGSARGDVLANRAGKYGQTQFIVSAPFNLSSVKNPVLSFSSGYMQNQDSYGGVEYSVDGGRTWLPVVYFLDGPDILLAADGSVDGVATLTTKQTDTSVWVDNGVVKGEAFGDAVAAPINSSIGDHIVPRVNDDGADGKRIEIFRLAAAAGKPDVRLRLSVTGSDSWYFWIDNIAFYDIAPANTLVGGNIGDAGGSTSIVADGAYTLVGGGVKAYDAAGDAIHFASEAVNGDFDKIVKVRSIGQVASDQNRGGIMVRESLDPKSPSIEITATGLSSEVDGTGRFRGLNSVTMMTRPSALTGYTQMGRSLAGVDRTLPNQWLRLRRVGNYFAAYVGVDGRNWSLAAERYAAGFSSNAFVGLFAASESSTGTVKATVEFESYGSFVSTDIVAPTLVSAGTLDKKIIGVKFSETLDSASVTPDKFSVSGASVTGASLGIAGDSVYLTVTGLASDTFTVAVSGVVDANGNPIAAGSSVNGRAASAWTAVDVGRFANGDPSAPRAATDDPVLSGQSVAVSSGDRPEIEVVAGGSNIWNAGDFEHYIYRQKTGDFDVQVEVARFDRSANTSSFGHAGIQVRESLYTGAGAQFTAGGTKVRDFMNTTYAEGNVDRTGLLIWRDSAGGPYNNGNPVGAETADSKGVIGRWGRLRAGDAGGAPLAGTSVASSRWLRVKRVGNNFYGFWSYDGVNWAEMPGNPRTMALSSTVLVGFAEMTDSPGATTNESPGSTENKPWHYNVLQLRNFGDTELPALTPQLAAAIAAELGVTGRPLQREDMLALTRLSLAGRGVTSLAGLDTASNLTVLDLSPDGSLPLDAPERRIDLSVLTRMPQLRELVLNGVALSSMEFVRSLPALTRLIAYNYPNVAAIQDYAPLRSALALEELVLEGHGLSNIPDLAPLTRLRYLRLGNNPIVDASPLSSLTGLLALNLYGTRVSSLQFLEPLVQLQTLDLSSPAIPVLRPDQFSSLRPLVHMQDLNLSGQPIQRASDLVPYLRGMTVLRSLALEYCPLQDGTGLGELTQLATLALSRTSLTSLDFLVSLTNLTTLSLGGSIEGPTLPAEAWAKVAALPNLTALNLTGQQLPEVGFLANHPKLTALRLDATRVVDVAPLATIRTLAQLFINDTLVSDLRPLLELPALNYLETVGVRILPPSLVEGRDIVGELRARGVNGITAETFLVPLDLPARGSLALGAGGLAGGFSGQLHLGGPGDNTLLRAEQSLAGFNGASLAAGAFVDDGPVNYDDDTRKSGRFAPDRRFPNLAGRSHDSLSMSLTGYVALRAGNYMMGVNSNDGFALSSGFDPLFIPTTNPAVWQPNSNAAVLSQFDGGRNAADTTFLIRVAADGLYPMRLLWEEGGGQASLEWWIVDLGQPAGSRRAMLLNDASDPASPKIYHTVPTQNTPPVVQSGPTPIVETGVNRTFRFAVTVTDAETTVQDIDASMSVTVSSRTPSVIPNDALVLHRGAEGFEVEILQTGLTPGLAKLAISAVDAGGLSAGIEVSVPVVGPANMVGFLRREVYEGITGVKVDDLRNAPSFPASPTVSELIGAPEVLGFSDNYGQRLRGYLMPPLTGDYVFYISADDAAELWLSTDDQPANGVLIAREPVWNNFRAYQTTFNRNPRAPENRSQPIHLEHGRAYYFEALQKEGEGGDHVEVAWQPPGGLAPADGAEPIPGIFFSAIKPTLEQANYVALPGVVAEPGDLLVVEGSAARFGVTPTGVGPFTFQWRFNGSPINGQTGSELSIPLVQLEDTGAYDVVVGNAYGVFQSRAARLQLKPVPLVSPGMFSLVGSATLPNGVLRLTPAVESQAGAAWLRQAQPVLDGFDSLFQFQITQPTGSGADGFAFVIQSVGPNAIGVEGAGIGYAGLAPSLAVEFDTWDNGPGFDPNGNHVSVQVRGGVDAASSLANTGTGLKVTLDDGLLHTARVRYASGRLSVFVDDFITPVLSLSLNLPDYVPLANGKAFVGFAGGTGALVNVHEIVSWRFQPSGVSVPVIRQAPEPLQYLFLGQTAPLEVFVPGYPLEYAWSKQGVALQNTDRIQGADSGRLVLNGVVAGDAGVYGVRVFNGAGSAEAGPISVNVLNTTEPSGLGHALREVYPNIAGVNVSDLTASISFPDHPSLVEFIPAFEAPDWGDSYGQRISALLWPPVTGDYRFFISADDGAELYLSTDQEPAHKVLIAREPLWNNFRAYQDTFNRNPTAPENRSVMIHLEAGRGYFMEALQKEGGQGDHISVAWQLPGGAAPTNGAAPISGNYLSSAMRSPDLPFIVQAPTAVGFVPGFANNISVQVAGVGVQYQWSRDGVELVDGGRFSGVHTSNLLVAAVADGDGGTYRLRATNMAGSAETQPIVVSVRAPSSFKQLSAASRVTPDLEAPGFSVLAHQVATFQPDSILRAERQLLGLVTDAAGEPLPNLADLRAAGPDGRLAVSGLPNWNSFVDTIGSFPGDATIPGMPGLTGSYNNAAFEIITYLELPQGVIRMGVTSDDGFQTSSEEVRDVVRRNVLGGFEGLRGAAETIFEFYVSEPGVYPFRTVWEQGQAGSSFEWYTFRSDGTRVLLNDLAKGGVKAYRRIVNAQQGTAIALLDPPADAKSVPLRSLVTVVLLDPSTTVDLASIQLTVAESVVASSVTRSGDRILIRHTPATPFAPDTAVAATVSFTEKDGQARTAAWMFQTTPIALNTLFIEAEDFDYGHGNWVKNAPIGVTGPYAGGSYQGLGTGVNGTPGDGSDLGIDYFEVASANAGPAYRLGTGVDIVEVPVGGGGGFRADFDLQRNFKVGWNDTGDWYNYTRELPTVAQRYRVFANLSSGGTASAAELGLVTSGAGTAVQSVQPLGEFHAPPTGAWEAFALVELKDASGAPVQPLLGGLNTFRFTTLPGGLDFDYLALVPVPGTAVPKPAIVVGPQSLSVFQGGEARFSVDATGAGVLTYQWKKGLEELKGETGPSLVVPSVQLADAGSYSVVVRNAGGAAESASAILQVKEFSGPPVEFRVADAAAAPGASVIVPVKVSGFNNVASFQFSMHWNPAILSIVNVAGGGLEGLQSGNFDLSADTGTLSVSWNDPASVGKSLAMDSTLLMLSFTHTGTPGTTTEVTVSGSPTAIKAVSGDVNLMPYTTVPGVVTFLSTVDLSGAVRFYGNSSVLVPGVDIALTGGATKSAVTGTGGGYLFTVNAGVDYTVAASKSAESPPSQGVTSLDISLVRRQILGITPLDSPYKLLAADVNGSGSVTTLDITLMRRLILGITNNFPGGAWLFVPSGTTFGTPTAPWSFDSNRRHVGLGQSLAGQDFIGIRKGDVNASWTPSVLPPPPAQPVPEADPAPLLPNPSRVDWQRLSSPRIPKPGSASEAPGRLIVGQGSLRDSREIEVPVRVLSTGALSSLQFSLEWNPGVFEFVRVTGSELPGFGDGNINSLQASSAGRLSVSWDDPAGKGTTVAAAGTEVLRAVFRTRFNNASASWLRFTATPTPVEMVTEVGVAPTTLENRWIQIGRPEDRTLLLPNLRGSTTDLNVPTWVGGRSVVEISHDLGSGLWRTLESIEGDGEVHRVPVSANLNQTYYRLRWEP